MSGGDPAFLDRNRHKLIRLRTRVRRALKIKPILSWAQLRWAITKVLRKPGDDPDDFAMVTAPVKPRLPRRSGAVAVDPLES